MSNAPVTCEVRYRLDPVRIEDFKAYAKIWIKLIERHGGTHHGYFIPRGRPTGIGISFPGVGEDGADDIAIALFTFPDDEAYLTYREKIANDLDGIEANARFGKQPPFLSYERVFLQPLPQRD
ncbi:NIPSNAP family protein [Rhizobium rhizogenes]|uniref:NIPSNAP family protein n=1 Tax=Rhizobium rhizogenes TaxID=359 RepID=UPI002270BAAC|nr:NIPSNAP family protein [Rhizobium rhizogenes]